jgi:hypothetical protein
MLHGSATFGGAHEYQGYWSFFFPYTDSSGSLETIGDALYGIGERPLMPALCIATGVRVYF